MSKYSGIFTSASKVRHRWMTDVPSCIPAYDITHVDADGHITILNPAPKKLDPWHPNFDSKDK